MSHPAERTATRPPPSVARTFGYGMLMGGADVIPGVSGGTVALLVGVYAELIDALRAAAGAVALLLRGRLGQARQAVADVAWRLVLPLGAGILLALGIGSALIPGLLERYPAHMAATFFGLIAGSLVVPWRRVRRRDALTIALLLVAGVGAFAVVGLPERHAEAPGLLRVFASAAVAICAMILPGVSGAFLLLILGVYEATLAALRALDVAYVAVFAAGAALGLGLFSRVLHWVLTRHESRAMAVLVGLMAGSLRALWPWLDEARRLRAPPDDPLAVMGTALLGLAAFVVVRVFVRAGRRVSGDEYQEVARTQDAPTG